MKKKIFFLIFIALIPFLYNSSIELVSAQSLNESIEEQLNYLDLTELENFFNGSLTLNGNTFLEVFNSLLRGEFNNNDNFFSYITNIIFNNVFEILPLFLSVIIITIICGIIKNFRSSFFSEEIGSVVLFVGFLCVVLIISSTFLAMFEKVKIIIENIAKLNEIMSPIILTLMIASGGHTSAAVYKPSVAFLSNGISTIMLTIVLPLIGLMTIFTFLSHLSNKINFIKFSDCVASIIKWIFGIIITIFGIFTTIQGISSAIFDGISIKVAKFAISNSIPIVGGIIKDGFDIVVAGSIIIKNAVGISSIIVFFFMIISPILYLGVFSFLLKITSAFCDTLSDTSISTLLTSLSKTVNYLIATIIVSSFMLFISILLMVFSANAFL